MLPKCSERDQLDCRVRLGKLWHQHAPKIDHNKEDGFLFPCDQFATGKCASAPQGNAENSDLWDRELPVSRRMPEAREVSQPDYVYIREEVSRSTSMALARVQSSVDNVRPDLERILNRYPKRKGTPCCRQVMVAQTLFLA